MNEGIKDRKIKNLIALYSEMRLEETLVEAKKLIKVYRREPFIFNIMGVTNAALGSLPQAIDSYKKALKLKTDYVEVYNNLGVAYIELKKYGFAVTCFAKAIKLNSNYADAYNNLGNTQKELGSINEAIKNYKIAVDIIPDNVEWLCNLGIAYGIADELDNAEKIFENAFNLDSENTRISYLIADNYYNKECYEKAIEKLDKVFGRNSTDAEALNLYGKILQKKESKGALEYYFKALELSEKNSEVLSNIGNFYFETRDLKLAVKYYRQSLNVNSWNN
jgi:tetratricopeptide (TPR) repeat protein